MGTGSLERLAMGRSPYGGPVLGDGGNGAGAGDVTRPGLQDTRTAGRSAGKTLNHRQRGKGSSGGHGVPNDRLRKPDSLATKPYIPPA